MADGGGSEDAAVAMVNSAPRELLDGLPPGVRRPWLVAALATVLLGLAIPPAPLPAGGLLILPGLLLVRILWGCSGRAAIWCSFLTGAVVLGWFSLSVRHAVLAGWLAMVPIAGLYALLGRGAFRGLCRLGAPTGLSFGVAVAAAEYLRAHIPEFPYPHGQPVHAVAEFPVLLRPLRWGGEVLGNLLLAWGAASLLDVLTSWRHGLPRWGWARSQLLLLSFLWVGPILLAAKGEPWEPAGSVIPDRIRVAALEPGLGSQFSTPPAEWAEHWGDNLIGSTGRFLREQQALPAGERVGLLLWPESALPGGLVLLVAPSALPPSDSASSGSYGFARPTRDGWGPVRDRLPFASALPPLPEGIRCLAGGTLQHGPARSDVRVVAALMEGPWRYTDHHEKRVAVPGGERIPFTDWLPDSWRAGLVGLVASSMGGTIPSFTPGPQRPPMLTTDGVPFAGLTCFDACFDWVSRDAVAAGARLLTVLTNEAWYEGGAELAQMTAMIRCRAVETGTPMVRCTSDGHTVAVDGDGYVVAQLPVLEGPRPLSPRILTVDLATGPGRLPPMAWLRRGLPWAAILLALLGFLHPLLVRARLPRSSSSRNAG